MDEPSCCSEAYSLSDIEEPNQDGSSRIYESDKRTANWILYESREPQISLQEHIYNDFVDMKCIIYRTARHVKSILIQSILTMTALLQTAVLSYVLTPEMLRRTRKLKRKLIFYMNHTRSYLRPKKIKKLMKDPKSVLNTNENKPSKTSVMRRSTAKTIKHKRLKYFAHEAMNKGDEGLGVMISLKDGLPGLIAHAGNKEIFLLIDSGCYFNLINHKHIDKFEKEFYTLPTFDHSINLAGHAGGKVGLREKGIYLPVQFEDLNGRTAYMTLPFLVETSENTTDIIGFSTIKSIGLHFAYSFTTARIIRPNIKVEMSGVIPILQSNNILASGAYLVSSGVSHVQPTELCKREHPSNFTCRQYAKILSDKKHKDKIIEMLGYDPTLCTYNSFKNSTVVDISNQHRVATDDVYTQNDLIQVTYLDDQLAHNIINEQRLYSSCSGDNLAGDRGTTGSTLNKSAHEQEALYLDPSGRSPEEGGLSFLEDPSGRSPEEGGFSILADPSGRSPEEGGFSILANPSGRSPEEGGFSFLDGQKSDRSPEEGGLIILDDTRDCSLEEGGLSILSNSNPEEQIPGIHNSINIEIEKINNLSLKEHRLNKQNKASSQNRISPNTGSKQFVNPDIGTSKTIINTDTGRGEGVNPATTKLNYIVSPNTGSKRGVNPDIGKLDLSPEISPGLNTGHIHKSATQSLLNPESIIKEEKDLESASTTASNNDSGDSRLIDKHKTVDTTYLDTYDINCYKPSMTNTYIQLVDPYDCKDTLIIQIYDQNFTCQTCNFACNCSDSLSMDFKRRLMQTDVALYKKILVIMIKDAKMEEFVNSELPATYLDLICSSQCRNLQYGMNDNIKPEIRKMLYFLDQLVFMYMDKSINPVLNRFVFTGDIANSQVRPW